MDGLEQHTTKTKCTEFSAIKAKIKAGTGFRMDGLEQHTTKTKCTEFSAIKAKVKAGTRFRMDGLKPVSYTHLTLPTMAVV